MGKKCITKQTLPILQKTGYSITTVSRVLNGQSEKYRISISTQEKIKATAEELNYTPNEIKQNLGQERVKRLR